MASDARLTGPPPTSDIVHRAESLVGAELQAELKAHFLVARELTNLAGRLVDTELEKHPGDPRAFHVSAIIVARLITDLQAVCLLVSRGYAAQALGITAGMLELSHMSMFIGTNEERATKWMEHDDPKRASPWTVSDVVKTTAKEIGLGEEAAKREYESIYRQANMAKHGNPMALGEVGLVHDDEHSYVLSAPHMSASVLRFSRAALLFGIRYTHLAAMKFARDHVAPEDGPSYWDRFRELSEAQVRLVQLANAADERPAV